MATDRSVCLLWLGLLLTHVAACNRQEAAAPSPPFRWTEQRVLGLVSPSGDRFAYGHFPQELIWIEEERRAVASGLLKLGMIEKLDSEYRIWAIIQAGRLGTPEAIRFCVKNLDLHLEKYTFDGDDDEYKEYPCEYALRGLGWAAVPYLFEALWDESFTDGKADALVRLLLGMTRSPSAALALLNSYGSLHRPLAPSPASNLQMLVDRLG